LGWAEKPNPFFNGVFNTDYKKSRQGGNVLKNIDIKCLGEQLALDSNNKVYYMELITGKQKEVFTVKIDGKSKQLTAINDDIIPDLIRLTKKKLLNEYKKGRKIKEIIKNGIKFRADALICKVS